MRIRTALAIAATAIALTSVSACGSSSTADSAPHATASADSTNTKPTGKPSAGASATATPSATATSTTKPGPSLPATPEAAAKALFAAWDGDDHAAALQVASPDAVDALWSIGKNPPYTFGGCSTGECDYNFAQGVIKMISTGNHAKGYRVTAVTFGSAG